jgi:hypothetical protein
MRQYLLVYILALYASDVHNRKKGFMKIVVILQLGEFGGWVHIVLGVGGIQDVTLNTLKVRLFVSSSIKEVPVLKKGE